MNQRQRTTPSWRDHTARLIYILVVYLAAPVVSSAGQPSTSNNGLIEAMARHISCYPLELVDYQKQKPLLATKDLCLATIYRELNSQPLWVTGAGPGPRAEIILERLRHADEEGMAPADYEVAELESLWDRQEPDALAHLDTLLTYNLLKYIHDLSYGRMKFKEMDPELFAEAGDDNFNPSHAVNAAKAAVDLNDFLEKLAPQHDYYRRLKIALRHYRRLAQKPERPIIADGPLIKPGDSDERLTAIRHRLADAEELGGPIDLDGSDYLLEMIEQRLTGADRADDTDSADEWLTEIEQRLADKKEPETLTAEPEHYHEGLVDAVKAFQRRHGLKPDGVIGPHTLTSLNMSVTDRVNTIRANMARWRWQAHDLGTTYLMINIAGFSLKAVQDDKTVLEMPVIVGKSQHQTPVFSDRLRYIDINPFWNVPTNIAVKEELPKLRQNRRSLVDKHIRLFSSWQADAVELDSTTIDWNNISSSQMRRYKLRQDPGPWNALGRIKFVFPNHHSVYLHDTPAHELFKQFSRSFSHGCIRVSRPEQLALFCLRIGDRGWTEDKIKTLVDKGARKVIHLPASLPVHLTYQTSWVDKNGLVHFNSDIYDRDAKLLQALDAR